MLKLASLAFIGSSLLVTACATDNPAPDPTATAQAGVQSAGSIANQGALIAATVDGSDAASLAPPTASQIASRIAAAVGQRWQPPGCATATVSNASIAITFADCSGNALSHITGTLDLTASVANSQITFGATGDLTIEGEQLTFTSTATLARSASGPTLAVDSSGSSTSTTGIEVTHDGAFTIAWDSASQCRDITGHYTSDLTRGTTTVANTDDVTMKRCGSACPTGTITDAVNQTSLAITLNGTPTATWTTNGGASGTVNLVCQ